MRDLSPEERAKRALFALDNTVCRTDEDEMRVLADALREAVEAERLRGMHAAEQVAGQLRELVVQKQREAERAAAEEREACAKLCEEASELSRKAANKHDHDDFRCRVASSRAHVAFMLAEKIRARGKESPRG
jgi:hypothetical protein